jgi:hypothetical protein
VALEQHIGRCPCCRQADEADRALRDVMGMHTGLLDPRSAQAFNDRVITALHATGFPAQTGGSPLKLAWQWAQSCWQSLPFPFLSQVAGGGLVAASVTMLFLLSSLHARSPVAPRLQTPEVRAALSAARNEPPVPLESLLRSPAPRAALLWTAPGKETERRPGASRAPRNRF